MRTVLNLIIATGLLFAFNAFGWLTLSHDGQPVHNLSWEVFGSVLLVAIIVWLCGYLADMIYIVGALLTFGLALLAFPFIGWLTLTLTAHFMPGTLTLHGFWITALCGGLLLIVRVDDKSVGKPKNKTSMIRES